MYVKFFIPHILLSALLTVTSLCLPKTGYTQQGIPEYEVKAVFIYNFVIFVEWPESAFRNSSDPFVIGIIGKNVVGHSLMEVVKGEYYQGRRIEVRNIASAEEASDCHIVYVHQGYTNVEALIHAVDHRPVLTIGESKDFLNRGGMIRFFLEQNKVKIEVNPDEVSNEKLKISSKLLRLAKIYNQ